jgi:hypothetical protein
MNRLMTMTLALTSMLTLIGCGAPPAVTASEGVLRFDGFMPGTEVTVRGESRDGTVSEWKAMVGVDGSFVGPRGEAVAVAVLVDGDEVLRERLQRLAVRELIPVQDPDLFGGLPHPEPEPLIDLPKGPWGVGPGPVGPQPLPLAEQAIR